jgi:hypothetical protein
MQRSFHAYIRILTMVEAIKDIVFGSALIEEMKRPGNQ